MGDGEGLSGSREGYRQRHRGKKFHGTLRNPGEGQPWSFRSREQVLARAQLALACVCLLASHCGRLDSVITSFIYFLNCNNSHLNTASCFPQYFHIHYLTEFFNGVNIVFPILEDTWKGSMTVLASHTVHAWVRPPQSVRLLTCRPCLSRKMSWISLWFTGYTSLLSLPQTC